uniref:Proteoglycan 4b n=1 Tax=Salarias fasciatus TaxID=181472 RepID=A0A672JGU2_SALFA
STPQDKPDLTTQDKPDPIPESTPQDKPESTPQDKPELKPESTPQDKPDPTTQDKPDPTTQDKPDPTTQDKPDPTTQDKPDPIPESTPQDKPESTPQDKPELKPESTPQDKPELKPEPKPHDKPNPGKPLPAKPSTKPVSKPQGSAQTGSTDDPKEYQSDDNHDTNLCSGRPVSGVTTLRNGTIVVFRGHYFWILDRNRVPGPAQGITQVWGVPSPIDTVFTRCNCQGKTYIFKGGRYWRFENDALDHGYPRAVQTGFDGLQGHITAALSVPQYQSRRESVYFFKRGVVQKYSYQFGTSPSCGGKVQYAVYTVRNRKARQAVSVLGPTINIQTSWRGFPSTVTAAASIPSSSEPEGYKYYVFSRSNEILLKWVVMGSTNDIFKCPQKV